MYHETDANGITWLKKGNPPKIEPHKPIPVAEKFFEEQGMKRLTCSICGCEFYDWTGCNPDPVIPEIDEETGEMPVCCHSCDKTFVMPARAGRKPGRSALFGLFG